MTRERVDVEKQLEAILASEEFASAPKMRALLRYLVDATLGGEVERLKGYAIGVDVFERGAEFDPGTDPIVRVQAGRLRKLLDNYYLTSGRHDPIRIDIPKGGYAVEFNAAADEEQLALSGPDESQPDTPEAAPPIWRSWAAKPAFLTVASALVLVAFWAAAPPTRDVAPAPVLRGPATPHKAVDAITLAVLPFTDMSKDEPNIRWADGLTDALTTALVRVKSLALSARTSAFQFREATDLRRVGSELGVSYILEGSLQRDKTRTLINIQLVDAAKGAPVWAQNYERPTATDDLAAQSELVSTLVSEILPQLYTAAKRALKGNIENATAWQLFLQSTWMPGEARDSLAWEKERIALARRALALDADMGQADSVLADKLSYLANVDPSSDTSAARAEAEAHARRALELAPDDADAIFNVSIHHWHAGRMAEALAATKRTLELDPNHGLARFLVKAIPLTCASASQSAIDDLIAFDTTMSPDNPVRWLTQAWISQVYMNNGDYERAVVAARHSEQVFRTPYTAYRLAASLVQLGDVETAVAHVKQQRVNWPTLDPRHYAEVTIPRLCGNAEKAEVIQRVYRDLAAAVEASERRG